MAETYQRLPDDDWFDEIDPLLWRYLYESWKNKQEQEHEMYQSVAILVGSFTNPEAAKQMIKSKNPDHKMTDEDFDKVSESIKSAPPINNSVSSRKKKRKIIYE